MGALFPEEATDQVIANTEEPSAALPGPDKHSQRRAGPIWITDTGKDLFPTHNPGTQALAFINSVCSG